VLNDLSTIEEWNRIKRCFPINKKGDRIIVSTTNVEVASLCVGQNSEVSELKQLSVDQTIYAFYKEVVLNIQRSSVYILYFRRQHDISISNVTFIFVFCNNNTSPPPDRLIKYLPFLSKELKMKMEFTDFYIEKWSGKLMKTRVSFTRQPILILATKEYNVVIST
jgi:hypothetical protein